MFDIHLRYIVTNVDFWYTRYCILRTELQTAGSISFMYCMQTFCQFGLYTWVYSITNVLLKCQFNVVSCIINGHTERILRYTTLLCFLTCVMFFPYISSMSMFSCYNLYLMYINSFIMLVDWRQGQLLIENCCKPGFFCNDQIVHVI